MKTKFKNAANHIVWKYQMGHISRSDAHEQLTQLNSTAFAMYTFNLTPSDFDPGEIQEYIHELQMKYTTVCA